MVGDESTLRGLSREQRQVFAVLPDPDGKTDIAAGYAPEEWAEAWARASRPILELCERQQLLVQLLEGGAYFVRATSDVDVPVRALRSATARLSLPTGRCAVVEALDLLRSKPVGPELPSYRELQLEAGTLQVHVHHVGAADLHVAVAGRYWSDGDPALVLGFEAERSIDTSAASNFGRLRNAELVPSGSQPGLHEAVVTRVDDDGPLLALYVSPNVTAGWARLEAPSSGLRKGQRLRVRLLEKQDGRWLAQVDPTSA